MRKNLLDEEDLEGVEDTLKEVGAVFHPAWNISEENFDTHRAWKGNMEILTVLTAGAR